MGIVDYRALYRLQDEVLDVVFASENIFYLTGGTCLSRFYKAKRYSDDLDFFADSSARYPFALRRVRLRLAERHRVRVEVESKDFARFRINDFLQVDFVNEHAPRWKEVVVTPEGRVIDNIENILANKLTAVVARDDPKDVFDVYLIWKFYAFSWAEILDAAQKKACFSDDILAVRLRTFPEEAFSTLKLIDPDFLKDFSEDRPVLLDELIRRAPHRPSSQGRTLRSER
ncbi:Nucleotidyl transferase AbiEii toxin, Type IV TA system [Desulfacinum infernum DSM 9756]|jgi:predicted nucleotidyltransferase component of viral defense system|uniref:Nucleotidyl transferase AbiEii toxin, Type IV TA system n=1 Tax=Desulfacinum infernum DSM 9756 TaxID=1121391 RepID=A0A1M5ASJ0_9BACT|nr:nucleotidyl transferase AbiEii/AbiGii toxin family protein [Desulfacinum infernum]SHF33199.1 Nucleotidyl transferase AbiEii toxin, Type IV TA system [Desulfacinum infernum DSM 9756]